MAKPFAEQAGSGCSHPRRLGQRWRAAISCERRSEGTDAPAPPRIGGMIGSVGDGFALFALHANSYRRFKANSYAL